MKKDVHFKWDQAYNNALQSIKKYLLNSSVLDALVQGKPLILYIAAQDSSLRALHKKMKRGKKEPFIIWADAS